MIFYTGMYWWIIWILVFYLFSVSQNKSSLSKEDIEFLLQNLEASINLLQNAAEELYAPSLPRPESPTPLSPHQGRVQNGGPRPRLERIKRLFSNTSTFRKFTMWILKYNLIITVVIQVSEFPSLTVMITVYLYL